MEKSHRLPGWRIPAVLKGTTVRTDSFVMKFVSTEPAQPFRIAIIVPVKIAKHATKRNRLKRLIREALREKLTSLPNGVDIIIMAQKQFPNAKLQDMKPHIDKLWEMLPNHMRRNV